MSESENKPHKHYGRPTGFIAVQDNNKIGFAKTGIENHDAFA
jgi:hypothetical protein